MSQEGQNGNGEKRLGAFIYRSVHLIVNLAGLILVGYISMWMKSNFPSKTDFKELQLQVNSLDRAVLQLSETNRRIDDFEQRIRKLEQRRPPL